LRAERQLGNSQEKQKERLATHDGY
jgi:hypothetical protein